MKKTFTDIIRDCNEILYEYLNVPQDVPQDNLDEKILDLIKSNKRITTQEIGKILGVSDKTIKRHIKSIDRFKYVGSGYNGHWEIIKSQVKT